MDDLGVAGEHAFGAEAQVVEHLVDADLAELLVEPARNRVQQTTRQDGQESEQFSDAHAAPTQASPGAIHGVGARKGCAMVLQRSRNKSGICHRMWHGRAGTREARSRARICAALRSL